MNIRKIATLAAAIILLAQPATQASGVKLSLISATTGSSRSSAKATFYPSRFARLVATNAQSGIALLSTVTIIGSLIGFCQKDGNGISNTVAGVISGDWNCAQTALKAIGCCALVSTVFGTLGNLGYCWVDEDIDEKQ